jgi:hypothetical protein
MPTKHPIETLANIAAENFYLLKAPSPLNIGRTTFYKAPGDETRIEVEDGGVILIFEYDDTAPADLNLGEVMNKRTGEVNSVREEKLSDFASYMLKCME